MALIKCPECGKEISDKAPSCPNCGCPADIIKEEIEQQKIEESKPKMVQACSVCGDINFNVSSPGYKQRFCLECKSRNITHTVIDLPYSCEQFEKRLLTYDRSIRFNQGIAEIYRELFEKYIKDWKSLNKESESYKLHYENMYCDGKGPAHDAIDARVAARVSAQKAQRTVSVMTNVPKCPTCGSTDIKKISTVSKAGSVFMWGLLSQKVKKQWHCNNCGSEW
jgi:hypothetical protein